MDPLFVIDASGYLYRAYHAIPHMTNPEGLSTNALFGFLRSLNKLMNDFGPQNIVCVFDGPHSTKKRKEIYEDYKSHRTETPPDLYHQIDWAREFCKLSGIPLLAVPEVEADDTIGSIAKWAEKDFEKVYLCTSDKDMAQLVNEKINLLNTHKDNLILGREGVKEQFGVRPDQIIDYLALVGDSSDNIPGVTGFGPKSASQILGEFETLDNALQNIDKISGKKGEQLKAEGEMAILSRKLAEIDLEVDFPKESTFFRLQEQDHENLISFYQKMGFHSLLKDVKKTEKHETDYHLIASDEELEALKNTLSKAKEVAFHVEMTDARPMWGDLVGVSFSIKGGQAFYVPFPGKIKELFALPNISFFGHNVKPSLTLLKQHGIHVNPNFDTALASFLLDSNERHHDLENLSMKCFGCTKMAITEIIGKGKTQVSIREVLPEITSKYCCECVDLIFRLKDKLQKEIEERGLERVYYDIDIPLIPVLAGMEQHGMYLDKDILANVGKDVTVALNRVREEIFQLAGEEFNINSPKQLSEILFTKLLIRPPKKTATGYSTSQEVLEELKSAYPIAEKLIEWRILEKMRSTYIESLPHDINPKTGRIHTTLNQFVAATGRLSSQDPNLQNIPTRNPIGGLIREAFRPEKQGYSYLACDYSQIELRLLAHFSEDPVLLEAFNAGEDIHQTTAAQVFGVHPQLVTKEMRGLAKAVNFGVIYGQGAFGLSQSLRIPLKEAKDFIETYFKRFARVKAYIEEAKELARKTGKAVTFTGRERPLPEIHNKNMQIKQLAERLAVNTPLQGGAADLIKIAMLKIGKELKKGSMILQIHDELLFEALDEDILEVQTFVKKAMEEAHPFKVPLIVNCKVGKNWKEC